MGIRIKDVTLPADYNDGEILYGSDMNMLINLLRNGVNYNKSDLDKLIFGVDSDYVFNTKSDADDYLLEETPDNGQVCFVMSDGSLSDTIYMYRYNSTSGTWSYYSTFSLLDIFYQNTDWYSGTVITGTGTNIEIAISNFDNSLSINDFYLNTDTSYIYKCVSISGLNSYWEFQLSLGRTLETYLDSSTTIVDYTLVEYEDKTFSNASITSVAITIPDTVEHGFFAGVNFSVGGTTIGAITFTNNSSYTLKLVKYGIVLNNYTPLINKTVGLAFYCDGININCYITEV